ncbi:MAG: glycosyltransferase family 4 protein [Cyanobacteria bacterium J06638_22]
MHVLFVQYGGDYREAVQRFNAGGEENYGYQKYSVEAVSSLPNVVEKVSNVSVLCCLTSEAYCETLSNGVQAIGMGFQDDVNVQTVVERVAALKPDALVIRTPLTPLIRWAVKSKTPTLCALADSFPNTSLRDRIKNFFLARLLNSPTIEWVANHNVTSSETLKAIGVSPNKILPWDWPALKTPDQVSPKSLTDFRQSGQALTLFYAGMISELKGVGDAIQAVAYLKEKGVPIQLNLAGRSETDEFQQQVQQLGLEENVAFLGLIPTHEVAARMRDSDFVLVPSRREYPEGFPKTVNEAFCARTPLVASDHPVFRQRLQHKQNAMIFESANAVDLANCILELVENPDLYFALSQSSDQAWQSLQVPLKWDALVRQWLKQLGEGSTSLADYSLASGQYVTS